MPAETACARADARRRGLAVFARLMSAARRQGLTARDVAAATGVRPDALSRWSLAKDSGKGPSYGELEQIAESLGARLADFARDEPPEVDARLARMRSRLDQVIRDHARLRRLLGEFTIEEIKRS